MRDRSLDIAVTGVCARLPGPEDLDAWFAAVCRGEALTTRLDPAQLLAAGVTPSVSQAPDYVPVRGLIADIDRFDAERFGMSTREAQLTDPQHRLMLEATWSALEDAGRSPLADHLRTAVFASSSPSRYAAQMLRRPDLAPDVVERIEVGTGRDFMATRIAYRLGLTGPALAVSTACSSSLVAVHLAIQALTNGDCDQAVVVAASLGWPAAGHRYSSGGIMSKDGLCRPFDADATGVVGGSGVLAVVLRRLADVGEEIALHGVLLGSAVNNDGAAKAGFSAPAARGQADAIRSALASADVRATSLGYLETHGTGTRVGDSIEWSAATDVLSEAGVPDGQVAVGASKANIGHLDAAAGLAGLVKATLVLRHGRIPPVANFRSLNPLLGTTASPLDVPTQARPWSGPEPRRAGVSSFGIGGTNAHVVVEQPPPVRPRARRSGDDRLSVIIQSSGRPEALEHDAERLARHLEHSDDVLADVAFTLRVGRAPQTERLALVARSAAEAARQLRSGRGVARGRSRSGATRPLIFLFPGQGSQRPAMATTFQRSLPGFADHLEQCLHHFDATLADQVRAALTDQHFPDDRIRATALAQPCLFAIEYAATRALAGFGLRPDALAGHSVGEVTAACVAGMLDLKQAAGLIARRGRSMQDCPPGSMLAVRCSTAEARELIEASGGGVELAAANGPREQVLSGTDLAVDEVERRLGRLTGRRLRTSHAFHSRLMEPAVNDLLAYAGDEWGDEVEIPFLSCVDGVLVERGSRRRLDMFARSARGTVRFGDGLAAIARTFPDAIAVEIGPGRALSGLATAAGIECVPLTGAAHEDDDAPARAVAALWAQGMPVDLAALAPPGRRVHLPGSTFAGSPRHVAPEAELTVETAAPQTEQHEVVGHPAARTPAEEVRAAWTEFLGIPSPRPRDDFTAQGGDSLTLIRLARRLEKVLPVTIELADLVEAQTLEDQITLVERLLDRRRRGDDS
ncbi:beta-ketoacyl synthase N-terminal-like domain-containing protein [Solwaraspora sp. WMMD1047]|uniref:type I polyketide synthase n=1 Tax=Solwaraspora sp. WMMD1047 TaxID=3016102 RepID=UPI002416904F|nr:beta-ketoacyl synthase N-terminal-like domain-containing protein [Solwaraspora sp. WMMD1047]MDG4829279.1 beta-ketoacyl synthase N-terminal-like domain-containing protein [Solwaraspora sp. WMMD1047]